MRSINIRTPSFDSPEDAEADLADRILQMFRDGVGGGVAIRRPPEVCYNHRRGAFVGTARFAALPEFVKQNEDGSITFTGVPFEHTEDTPIGLAAVKDAS